MQFCNEGSCGCNDTSCGDGNFCNSGGDNCQACALNTACGMGCDNCQDRDQICVTDGTPEGSSCMECDPDTDAENTCGAGRKCGTDGACEACDEATACGPRCEPCGGDTPFCDMDLDADIDSDSESEGKGVCVECLTHDDCGTGTPFNSPIGACSPEGTCTCWVPQENETASCTSGNCPPGTVCAVDFDTHYACLRPCDSADVGTLHDGMICDGRITAPAGGPSVWVPATSCFAFNKYRLRTECVGANSDIFCSVDGHLGLEDGICLNSLCTYTCAAGNDDLCPTANCTTNNYCVSPQPDADTDPSTDTAL
jgi:hypothetical protein